MVDARSRRHRARPRSTSATNSASPLVLRASGFGSTWTRARPSGSTQSRARSGGIVCKRHRLRLQRRAQLVELHRQKARQRLVDREQHGIGRGGELAPDRRRSRPARDRPAASPAPARSCRAPSSRRRGSRARLAARQGVSAGPGVGPSKVAASAIRASFVCWSSGTKLLIDSTSETSGSLRSRSASAAAACGVGGQDVDRERVGQRRISEIVRASASPRCSGSWCAAGRHRSRAAAAGRAPRPPSTPNSGQQRPATAADELVERRRPAKADLRASRRGGRKRLIAAGRNVIVQTKAISMPIAGDQPQLGHAAKIGRHKGEKPGRGGRRRHQDLPADAPAGLGQRGGRLGYGRRISR